MIAKANELDCPIIVPLAPDKGNSEHSLHEYIEQLRTRELNIPSFQREDGLWTREQIKSWIDSVMSRKAIGVIVTYNLEGSEVVWLADGLQRLSATIRFIEKPSDYGFSITAAQAIAYCKAFSITIQHRVYVDHLEAMRAFQKLNSGTSLTNMEFYLGELSLLSYGDLITKKVPAIVKGYEFGTIKRASTSDRKSSHKLVRDCYGLFLQYISETDSLSFWDVGTTAINSNKGIVERELAKYINDKKVSRQDMENFIKNFDKFIAEQVAEIREILEECGGKGLSFSQTMLRWMLHLAIWRKNTKKPYPLYKELVSKIFTYQIKEYKKIQSKVDFVENGIRVAFVFQLGKLDLSKVCKSFNSNLYDGYPKKRIQVAPGYHDSHIEPFSTNGNGKTFPEPGLRNRARGAKPITVQDTFLNDSSL